MLTLTRAAWDEKNIFRISSQKDKLISENISLKNIFFLLPNIVDN